MKYNLLIVVYYVFKGSSMTSKIAAFDTRDEAEAAYRSLKEKAEVNEKNGGPYYDVTRLYF